MVIALLLGGLVGAGALLSWRLLFPAPPPLQAAVDRLHRRNELANLPAHTDGDAMTDLVGRTVGVSLARFVRGLGLNIKGVELDLRLVGRTLEQHLSQKIVLGLFGLSLPVIVSLILVAGGIEIPLTWPVLLSIVMGLLFFFAPDIGLRHEARERRASFKHALGSFLDLVVISLAGGAGVESALRDAAAIGRGWDFVKIHEALESTSLTGETPWAALARLGEEIGIPELEELSSSLSLAGTEGARVRESLGVKASSLRDHALADAEAEAQATTEKMAVPTVMLFLGFLILVGYPAVSAVLSTL